MTRPPISRYHKWVLALAFPFVVIVPFVWIPFAFRAVESPTQGTRQHRFYERIDWIMTGQHVLDVQALPMARVLFVVWVASMVLTVVLVALPAIRDERRARRAQS